MGDEEIRQLKKMNRKLDELIILGRISNLATLEEFGRDIKRDKVARAIIEVADGTLSYSEIAKAVSSRAPVSERTVKGRISELVKKGILTRRREGREVFYERSDLFVW
ncbi:MAG: BlaI/MecI/CopY family transcriptional regulator [Thermoplasmata archaeon]